MRIALATLIVAGTLPIARAIWANRGTSLLHALVWTLIAWLTWGIAFLLDDAESTALPPARYCALCLTGCAGVAVLGARRPHVFAWNFVVLSLFAVMVWPLFETQLLGTHTFDGLRIVFMAGTIAVGIVNYLPTRLGPAALLLLLIGAFEMIRLHSPASLPITDAELFSLPLAALPWICWGLVASGRAERSEFDRLWLDFRDRWGLVWSQRVREQFNHAAEHAGWPVKLAWRGLREDKLTSTRWPTDGAEFVDTLRSVLKRFVAVDQNLRADQQDAPR